MVIDTSAIAAILFREDDRDRFIAAIDASPIRLVSAVTRVELAFVVAGRRKDGSGRQLLEEFFSVSGAEIVAVTPQQAMLAIDAFRAYGKGRHPAGLNIGDCFPYALARATGHPLLFKGRDFSLTDVQGVR